MQFFSLCWSCLPGQQLKNAFGVVTQKNWRRSPQDELGYMCKAEPAKQPYSHITRQPGKREKRQKDSAPDAATFVLSRANGQKPKKWSTNMARM